MTTRSADDPGVSRVPVSILPLFRTDTRDIEIAEKIKGNLPEDAYSAVDVSRTKYDFFGLGAKPARVITLTPTGEKVKEFLKQVRRFFVGFPVPKTYNASLLKSYVLGEELNEEDKTAAKAELVRACSEQRRIYIYVSEDLTSIFCKVEDSRGICVIS